jgi:putative aminopeptidase FrvX
MISKESKAFLHELLLTPSPTGYEEKIQKVVRTHMKPYAETIETDLHGNVIIGINTSAKRKVMLAGHCDQIGLMVKHINKDGFIYVSALGGIDVGVLPGTHCTIHTASGEVQAIVGRKPIHAQTAEERGKVSNDLDKIWLDIGAANQKEAQKKVQIGDSITFKLQITELGKDLISAPGLDDKVGVFIAMEALKMCAKAKLNVGFYAVSTVQEEVGLRGAKTAAYSIDPTVGIAIDVTHATDNPGSTNPIATVCKLGSGPAISRGPNTNPVVEKMLVASAKKFKIPHQLAPSASLLGNDANAIQVSRGGVATASIGIPNRYMHTQVEVCSYSDLVNSSKLLAEFIKSINDKTDFRPMA